MKVRATIKDPKMPKTRALDGEIFIKYTKIKKNLKNPFLRLFVSQSQKDLVNNAEALMKNQEAYADYNDQLFNEMNYKLSKINAIPQDNGTIEISRFDDFVEHKTIIEQLLISRNISFSWLNNKLLVNDPSDILNVANAINKLNVSWCTDNITKETDGCFVITHLDTTLQDLEQLIAEKRLEIQPDRPEQKSTFSLPNAQPNDPTYEDVDEVFEPLTIGEKKKLKSRAVINQFKAKKALVV